MAGDKVRWLQGIHDVERKNIDVQNLRLRIFSVLKDKLGLHPQFMGTFRDQDTKGAECLMIGLSIFDKSFQTNAGPRHPTFRHAEVRVELTRILRDWPAATGLVRFEKSRGGFVYQVYLKPSPEPISEA